MNTHVVGTSPHRKEGYDKVTGRAKYIDDLLFSDCLYGKTVRATIPRGKIKSIRYHPDIPWNEFVIVTAKDVPGENVVALITADQPFLADEQVYYRGEPILLLAHPDQSLVEHAADYVQIDYDELVPVLTMEQSLNGGAVQYGTDNVFKQFHFGKGSPAAVWDQADLVLTDSYATGAQEHVYIEPQGMVAIASPEKGVTVWGSMQCPYYIHKALMKLFALPEDKIRVVFAMTGGGFGGKEEYPNNIAGHAALLSWHAGGRPVKIIYSREEDLLATTKRHPAQTRIKSAFNKDGKLLALEIDVTMDGGAYVTLSPVVLSRGVLHAFGPYNCANVEVTGRVVFTNNTPYGAFRGFGAPQTIFALERHLDQVAARLGILPHELRMKNLLHRGDTMATGQEITENIDLEGLMHKALSESRYQEKRREYAEFNRTSAKLKKGIGLALFFHGSGFTGSGEVMLASRAGLRAHENGSIEILTVQTEIGQGAFTTLAQIVADSLAIPFEQVVHANPDTAQVPNSGPTVASRTCMVIGGLLQKAAQDLVGTLQSCGVLGQEYNAGQFQQAVQDYLRQKGELVIMRKYQHPPGINWDENTYQGAAYAAYAWACYVADIEVDLVTYQPKLKDFVAVQEVGKAIHPVIAAGQIEGGVAQALGWTFFENVVMKNGAMHNNQLTNYIIPTSEDTPPLRVFFFESPYRHGPFGAKGLGELPMDGPAPALANALAFAIEHQQITAIPLLPEKILNIIEERS